MARAVAEWIGKTPDTKVPTRVRLRIFERENGICHLSGRKIRAGEPWDLDHKLALINKGQHRETNLFPALRDKHREKTKEDVAEKAFIYATRAKHIGARAPSSRPIANRSFPRSSKAMAREEKAKASPRASLPPRQLYAEAKPLTDSEKATLRAGQRSRQARGNRPVTLAKVAE
jgi:5-methylcytosine-specific restriction protein A